MKTHDRLRQYLRIDPLLPLPLEPFRYYQYVPEAWLTTFGASILKLGCSGYLLPVLCAVPDAQDFGVVFGQKPIDDNERGNDQLAGAGAFARSPDVGEGLYLRDAV